MRDAESQATGGEAESGRSPVVLVTGVGGERQVGAAVGDAFAARGADLVLVGHDPAMVEARRRALTARGVSAWAFACDLTDPEATNSVAERVARSIAGSIAAAGGAVRGAGLDTVVHVAGGFAMTGPIGSADVEVFHRQVAMNLTTAFVASRAFVPLVRDGGSIVYVTSAAALRGAHSAGMAAYVAAKAGVIGLMQSVADEGRARGVRANAIAPTAIATGDNLRDGQGGAHLVGLSAVTDTILFLASPAAAAVTGQVLRLSD